MQNKDISYYMSLEYQMNIIPDYDEGGYTVYFPELTGCVTCGESIQEAIENALDAKKTWFEACIEDGITIPEPNLESYSGQFRLRVPKSLHKRISEHAKSEGVSMNSYCTAILSKYA